MLCRKEGQGKEQQDDVQGESSPHPLPVLSSPAHPLFAVLSSPKLLRRPPLLVGEVRHPQVAVSSPVRPLVLDERTRQAKEKRVKDGQIHPPPSTHPPLLLTCRTSFILNHPSPHLSVALTRSHVALHLPHPRTQMSSRRGRDNGSDDVAYGGGGTGAPAVRGGIRRLVGAIVVVVGIGAVCIVDSAYPAAAPRRHGDGHATAALIQQGRERVCGRVAASGATVGCGGGVSRK
ncbi:hypothetical protein BDN70DRAFT_939793 [Pholiota conissans]|uniref:Uncharacterized protein n=1 Tax=Pholiota conissans TaxID=109636 RepID=A0A9P6CKT3_9AGAR|nr:hypothetical protein BDN70DRAFT_939793 [Pholiota conissans]